MATNMPTTFNRKILGKGINIICKANVLFIVIVLTRRNYKNVINQLEP